MSDLATFIRARLDEQEAQVDAYLDSYDADPRWRGWHVKDGEVVTSGGKVIIAEDADLRSELAALVAANDPWRLLAEVEAKRRILDLHSDLDIHECVPTGQVWPDLDATPGTPIPCPTLRLLALPWAAHPDYRPEWAPAGVGRAP